MGNEHKENFPLVTDSAIEGELYKVVEEMPIFPGCEDILDLQEKKDCSSKKLRDFIDSNLIYPKEAIDEKVEGLVFIQFIVNKNGVVSNAQVLNELGFGCDQAVIDLFNLMNREHVWIPGKKRGEPVAIIFTLPIEFKL
jgi:protein TonB